MKNKAASKNLLKPAIALLIIIATLAACSLLLETLALVGMNVNSKLLQLADIILIVISLLSVVDILLLRRIISPTIVRCLPISLSVNRWHEATLLITNEFSTNLTVTIFDHVPSSVEFQQLPQTIVLKASQQYLLKYPIKPLIRGDCSWLICELIITSPWRLWQQRRYLTLENTTRVYPDFTKLYGSNIATIDQWIYYLGVRPQPRRGLGLDFHQLREFREGDTLKQIDWNATARHKTPIAKEYQDERDQQIIFLLDCGQRMRIKENNLSHFDHALNACLLLSYVAIRQGDAVGLATFAAEKNIFIKPTKGQQQLNILLNNVYDLQSSQQPADYTDAIQILLANTKRRSLVILITNLRYSENNDTINSFKHLSKYHKVLIASLREEISDEIATTPFTSFNEALTYCGDIQQLFIRKQLHDKLAAQHLPVLDVLPKYFAPQLVNHYLSLKRSGAL